METQERNSKMNRVLRYLLLIPLLVLPVAALLYWTFDNGLSEEEEAMERRKRTVAFMMVPESLTADEPLLDKASYYEMADRDSIKFQELARNDPYYKDALPPERIKDGKYSAFDKRILLEPYIPEEENTLPPRKKKSGKNTSLNGRKKDHSSNYRNNGLSDDKYRSGEENTFTPRKKKSGTNTSLNGSQKDHSSNYRNNGLSDNKYGSGGENIFPHRKKKSGLNTLYGKTNDPNTDEIYRKLEELNREINKPVPDAKKDTYQTQEGNSTLIDSPEVEKLEKMMQAMNQPSGEDPELKQLSAMLDKILDVQYPERAQEKFKKDSEANRGKVFAVSSQKKDNALTTSKTEAVTATGTNGFYSLTESSGVEDSQNAIKAVVHQTQTVVNGSTVKLRLVDDVFINGVRIPKDNFLYGIAALNGERLSIKINSVRYNNSLFPVELSVYDMDGLDGIYIPGAITREVARQSADRTMQTIGLTSLDSSLGLQAAGAGIEAAKSLLSQKVKQIKVTVKAGYQVLLQDEKQTQSS